MLSSQQPPPYHIAKAFTKKSKQDLLIYDIYRNNYQHKQSEPHLANIPEKLISTLTSIQVNQIHKNDVFLGNNISNSNGFKSFNRNDVLTNAQSKTSSNSTPWLFGEHKNPTVASNKQNYPNHFEL